VQKGRDVTAEKDKLRKEQEAYLKLYPHLSESSKEPKEPFPQRKHFYDMPKGVFSLKKEIHLEKLLMITRPGTVTFQLQYDNRVDFYLEGRQRVGIATWKDKITSNTIMIIIE
jgi:hypothetical protein